MGMLYLVDLYLYDPIFFTGGGGGYAIRSYDGIMMGVLYLVELYLYDPIFFTKGAMLYDRMMEL